MTESNYAVDVLTRELEHHREVMQEAQRRVVDLNKAIAALSQTAGVSLDTAATPKNHEHVHMAQSNGNGPMKAEELFYIPKGMQGGTPVEASPENAGVTTAQENAGPAPWEAEADPEPTSKPKRRTNEQLAADAGVSLDDVKEWKGGGRITKADIEEFARSHPSAVNNQTLDESAQEEQDGQDGVPHEPAPFDAPATDAGTAPAASQAAPAMSTGTSSPSSAPASEPEETPEAEFADADDEAEEVDDGWKPPF